MEATSDRSKLIVQLVVSATLQLSLYHKPKATPFYWIKNSNMPESLSNMPSVHVIFKARVWQTTCKSNFFINFCDKYQRNWPAVQDPSFTI